MARVIRLSTWVISALSNSLKGACPLFEWYDRILHCIKSKNYDFYRQTPPFFPETSIFFSFHTWFLSQQWNNKMRTIILFRLRHILLPNPPNLIFKSHLILLTVEKLVCITIKQLINSLVIKQFWVIFEVLFG